MRTAACKTTLLLQLRVLGFGLLQDGDVGVGIFPEGEEIFVSSKRPLIRRPMGILRASFGRLRRRRSLVCSASTTCARVHSFHWRIGAYEECHCRCRQSRAPETAARS